MSREAEMFGTMVQARDSDERALVHVEDVVSLVARAEARTRFPELSFCDPAAEELRSRLDVPDDVGVDETALRGALLSTMAIDGIVKHFFERHPDGMAVALHPGLCSRFSRLDNGGLQWIDVDPPAIAELKCRLLRTPARHVIAAACSLTCKGWVKALSTAHDVPMIVIHQGASKGSAAFVPLFDQIVRTMPSGTEYVVDYDARLPLRPASPAAQAGRRAGTSLELPAPGGMTVRYPRVRFVPQTEYGAALQSEIDGINSLSRLFQGRFVSSVAHFRFV